MHSDNDKATRTP